ncbi:NAD(P)/FAD-dependent oxidoreductase [Patescibacteria group bacterium]|nr:NAD(P)/FAD-dependent oxidoreductase [Patescibacteria group bacterium]
MPEVKESESVAIIGGGAVGLAIARELSQNGYEVFLFEQAEHFGSAQSTRNSGVIHAGMYYQPNSLKAKLCVQGRKMLYEFCQEYHVPFFKTGKIIVTQNAEEERKIDFYLVRGWANGVEGLRKISCNELKELEPNIEGYSALYSPETGIVDATEYIRALAHLADNAGAQLFCNKKAVEICARDSGFELRIADTRMPEDKQEIESMEFDWLINSAGVYADEIAAMVNSENKNRWHVIPVRGEYCKYYFSKRPELAIRRCVYGLPEELRTRDGTLVSGLGVHLVPVLEHMRGKYCLSDSVLVGPTMKAIFQKDDYKIDRYPESYFLERARLLLPQLRLDDLHLDYAGIRSELRESSDFLIQRDTGHSRCIHLLGIRSPGLTASLAIARFVKENFLQVAI